MIKVENLSLSYPGQIICKNLNFTLAQGESLCFSGASGKGKTSLIKTLMGIVKPDSGQISINNLELNIHNLAEIRKKMVWLPQNVNLPINSGKELTDLLQFTSRNMNTYCEYLKQLGIEEYEQGKLFTKISGGQKQRIVLAACLSLDKPILLLDEPVSALDDYSIDLFMTVVQSLKNKTIVSTSHNRKWLKHCSQIIEL